MSTQEVSFSTRNYKTIDEFVDSWNATANVKGYYNVMDNEFNLNSLEANSSVTFPNAYYVLSEGEPIVSVITYSDDCIDYPTEYYVSKSDYPYYRLRWELSLDNKQGMWYKLRNHLLYHDFDYPQDFYGLTTLQEDIKYVPVVMDLKEEGMDFSFIRDIIDYQDILVKHLYIKEAESNDDVDRIGIYSMDAVSEIQEAIDRFLNE